MNKIFRCLLLWLTLAMAGAAAQAADFPGTKVLFETGKADIPVASAGDLKAVAGFLAANAAASFGSSTGGPASVRASTPRLSSSPARYLRQAPRATGGPIR